MISPANGTITPVTTAEATSDPVLCHCLRVRVSHVREAIAVNGCQTLKEIMDQTSAGGGCTACHRRILAMLGLPTTPRQRLSTPCSARRCDCGQCCACRNGCSE